MSDCHMPVARIDGPDMRKSSVSLGTSVRIDLLEEEGEFLGLGAVSSDGISLRNPSRPMFVYIRNPWGVQLCNFRVAHHEERADTDATDIHDGHFRGRSDGLAASRVPPGAQCH